MAVEFESETKADVSPELFREAYRYMVLARTLEEKLVSLYRANKIVGGVYVGKGQEAFSVALAMQLHASQGDKYGPLIRDQAGRLAFGEPLEDSLRTFLGSSQGPMKGRDGNIHRGRPLEGMPAMISHLGSLVSVVNGMLMARRLQGKSGSIGGVCCGDGGTSTGAFHEAVNQAAVEKLPLLIAVANNQFAYSTPTAQQFACENLVDRAEGYGIEGAICDGSDLADCLAVFQKAAERVRAGEGPQLIVGKLLRLSGHGEHDDAKYVPEEVRRDHFGRDCIEVARTRMLEEGWMTESELDSLKRQCQELVDDTTMQVQQESGPSPIEETWHALATDRLTDWHP